MTADVWRVSRSGSHAGRGFRYQDAVATELAVRSWCGELEMFRIVPEGLEDVSLELARGWLHLQAKSRREHRGQFSLPELADAWRHLAHRLVDDPVAHAGLVLERPLPGAESGFDHTLAEVASDEARSSITAAVANAIDAENFLDRCHVIVMPSPGETSVALLAEKVGRAPAACVAHEAILRAELGALADENGVRSAADPAAMTTADIARLLEDVSESTDPSLLDEAVREGIAELADFLSPLEDEAFFQGVDVVAGHVVAGLPQDRPEVDAVTDALTRRQVALVVGPSGAGKSALMWLAAFSLRHIVRWYRVRRLHESDVPALVRLVKAQAPATVGFVVDDIGRQDKAGFDHLVEDLRGTAHAALLAACREEDLFLVRSAPGSVQIRPILQPELAERIWLELHERGGTSWAAWREPFEASQGLLLEYGHILTAGSRLADTVTAQVDQRVRDRRDLELDVLALVSTADAFGAAIGVTQLSNAAGADDPTMKSALSRLIQEHLIHESGGVVSGLHEVRSRHLMAAVHRVPPPVLSNSIRRVIQLVPSSTLQSFLTQLLLDAPASDSVILDAIVERLEHDPDLPALAGTLHALRVVGFRRSAESWRAIADREGAAPTDIAVISHFVLSDGDYSIFPSAIRSTIDRLREIENTDLRAALLPRIRGVVARALATASDLPSVITVLAALGELGESTEIDAGQLVAAASAAPLIDIRSLLTAAYAASPSLATAIAEGLGGPRALLERLQVEQPWVRHARLGTADDGRTTAEADYAFVAESAQPDPHGEVVELARWLLGLGPVADVAVCRAVDARGETAGYGGVSIADKRIDRENLPNAAAIAWNRARARAAVAVVAAPTLTEYAIAARDLFRQTRHVIQGVANAYARGKKPPQPIIADAVVLAITANGFRPAPLAVETAGPLDEGDYPEVDPVAFVANMISNNLVPRLIEGANVAPLIDQIVKQVDQALALEVWKYLDEPPTTCLVAMRRTLVDLQAVILGRQATSGARSAVVAAGKKGLTRAALAARRRSMTRGNELAERLSRSLGQAGYTARVIRREAEETALSSSVIGELLVLVEVNSVLEWLTLQGKVADVCRQNLPGHTNFSMAPVRLGRAVASYAVKVITDVFPDPDVQRWSEVDFVDEVLGGIARSGISGLAEVSGVLASLRTDQLHDVEQAALEHAATRAREAYQELSNMLSEHEGDRVLAEVSATYAGFVTSVEHEVTEAGELPRTNRGFAASMLQGLNGEPSQTWGTVNLMLIACAEWDIEPTDAWSRLGLDASEPAEEDRTDRTTAE